MTMLSETIGTLVIPGATLALTICAVAVGYGATRAKAEAATAAVERLGERMDIRLDRLEDNVNDIAGDVREIQGELKSMRRDE
jgi:chaperonin cofactor prefoldin